MNFLKSSKFAWLLTVVSVLALAVMFFTTSPQSAKLFGILVVIIALYGVFLGVVLLVGSLVAAGKRKKLVGSSVTPRRNGSHRLEISAVLALAPVLAIVLNSLGAIGVVELILVAVFEGVVIFLIRKKR
jgi:NAD/NADP transhydrogenase beta subunit